MIIPDNSVWYSALYRRLYYRARFTTALMMARMTFSDRRVLDCCEIDDRRADDCKLYGGKGAMN